MSGARGQKGGSLNTVIPTNLSQTPGLSLHMFLSKGRGERTINNSLCSEKSMRYSSDFQKSSSELSLSSTCALLHPLLCLDSYLLQTGQNSLKSWPALAPKLPPFLRIPQFPFPELSMPNLTKNHNQVQMLAHLPCMGEGTPRVGGF